MIPEKLKNIFDVYVEDDETSLFIERAEMPGDELTFEFALSIPDINDEGPVEQRWRVTTLGYKTSRISFDHADHFNILEEHPLLWDFTDKQSELYFKGEIKDPKGLSFDLYQVHYKLFGAYKPFSNLLYVDENYNSFWYTNGLLAKGAKKTLLEYGRCLEQNGVGSYLLGDRDPVYWTGSEHIPESKNLKLLLMQKSFIIAEVFSFVQLS